MSRIKKIEVSFGGGVDTILFSVSRRQFFSYEQNRDELHRLYGGLPYYTSGTGLTGAGFLQPTAEQDDLIKFGWYRTDARGQQGKEIVIPSPSRYGKPVCGYVPITNHGGIDRSSPIVLSDGDNVVFSSVYDAPAYLNSWATLDFMRMTLTYYAAEGYTNSFAWGFLNENHMSGVRATRFLDLERASSELRRIGQPYELYGSHFDRALNIFSHMTSWRGQRWFHVSPDYYLDMMWETDPREIVGEIRNGWIGTGTGLFWRRSGVVVQAFVEREFDGNWVEYEEEIPVLTWFQHPVSHWVAQIGAELEAKAASIRSSRTAVEKPVSDLREWMAANPEVVVRIQDSLDAGNCVPGTASFVRSFGIELIDGATTVGALLENPNIERMLESEAFRRVMWRVLPKPAAVPADADEEEEPEFVDYDAKSVEVMTEEEVEPVEEEPMVEEEWDELDD